MNRILLTFDVEEFDVPLEFGGQIGVEEQMEVGTKGLEEVLKLVEKHQLTCTFFTTAAYALARTELVKQIAAGLHEIASHGYHHSSFEVADLKRSKDTLETLLNVPITGYRMARLAEVDDTEIQKAGYTYNSSMNPTWIPGRYNHLNKPRTPFFTEGVLTVPTSVTPVFRIPLFWLSIKKFPHVGIKKNVASHLEA
jgi:peptidoglycan/xylan/chitin deacetylase (PgdA/CDA1 family)